MMPYDYTRSALKECPTLRSLNDNELDILMKLGEREVFKKGEEVFTIHHQGKKFYVVIEGRLLLRLKNHQSKEYKKGELFGEVSILGDTFRTGTILATEESMLLSISRDDLFYSDKVSKDFALKLTLLLSQKAVSYVNHVEMLSSIKMIEKGESDYIEFKASLHDQNKDVIAKNIASFMNLNGGTILCGVNDEDGKITGVNVNQKQFDELQKMMNREIRKRLGSEHETNVSYDIECIDDKKIIRIDCSASNTPVFFKRYDSNGNCKECFVVRSGSENRTIKRPSELIRYIKTRYKSYLSL